ncbi:surfeit locus 1 family protein [Natronospira proteinivora]|uniref:SURF1-like protein n=1 Tax=Natronospira proteinivora TaxID=1807133 RepID=A0ABT1GA68_9GAMM|nr:SURF1 family protein [Natronospira proteinivora]MCP1727947.1 surfeit locus 1 family protein [Natronospira proteinivora]
MTQQRRWQFKPPVWACLLTLLTVLLFSALSFWQVNRAEEKREILAYFQDEHPAREVVALEDLEGLPPYADVRLRGHFLSDRQFLLENMLREGQPGFHVWTPFKLQDDDAIVIVDRGWIVEQDAPPSAPGEEARTVEGQLNSLPEPGFRLSAPIPSGDWPRRIYFPTRADLEEQLDTVVFDGRLMMSPEESPGYRRDFEPINMPPERHLAYAFQWGALALAVFIVFLVVNLKRVRRP